MSRPKKTPENSGLMPWPEVAKHVGLSPRHTAKIGREAMQKLQRAFSQAGMDEDYLRDLAHDREKEDSLRGEALTAIVQDSNVE